MSTNLLYDTSEPDHSVDLLGRLAFFAETSNSDEEKAALLWDLTDFFLESAETCAEGDRDFFGELMEDLAFGLEIAVREALARKIAAEAHMPRGLIVRLANDNIPVARPVLEASPVLTDDDLVDISRNQSQDHLLAITKREALSYRLTTVLAERGNQGVVKSLMQNPNANLSDETIKLVMGRGESAQPVQSALLKRNDIPQEVLFDLLKSASDIVKREIEHKLTATDQAYLEEVVDTLKSEFDTDKKSLAKMRVDSLIRRNALNETVLLRFIRENEPMKFLLGFAAMIAADVAFTRKVIGDPTGQMLLVACRASKISFEGLKEIASSSLTAMSCGPRGYLELSKSYQRITQEDAKEMLRGLKLRNKMQSA